ncbi:MAG TPA: oxalate/formate MFS antiporter, partial [Methylobacterium sp.]
GNLLMQATGTWATVLYTVAAMDLLAAFLAIAVLRPMLKRHHEANGSVMPAAGLAHA